MENLAGTFFSAILPLLLAYYTLVAPIFMGDSSKSLPSFYVKLFPAGWQTFSWRHHSRNFWKRPRKYLLGRTRACPSGRAGTHVGPYN